MLLMWLMAIFFPVGKEELHFLNSTICWCYFSVLFLLFFNYEVLNYENHLKWEGHMKQIFKAFKGYYIVLKHTI